MSLLPSKRMTSNVRFAPTSWPFSSRMLRFIHSTTNCLFGAVPRMRIVTEPGLDVVLQGETEEGRHRSSQNGAINEGGTVPALPPGRVTVCAGRDAFWNSAFATVSRLSQPLV